MNLVGIDSMILIFAGIVPCKPTRTVDPTLSTRARLLLYMLAKENRFVVLPNVAVAEVLIPVAKENHGKIISILQKQFICYDFDTQAATQAANIWALYKSGTQFCGYDRNVMKADSQIVGTAKAAGCRVFYSHDENCRNLAGLVMEARDLPKNDYDLFLKKDIENGTV